MGPVSKERASESGFSLTDLLVVILCVGMLVLLVIPALASSSTRSASAVCLANLRRLQTAAEMYRTENNDTLIPNSPVGTSNGWIGNATEGWGSVNGNTNLALYANALIGRYLGNDLSVLRCPGDVVPSANGVRIRSYSMNGQMGYVNTSVNIGWRSYTKGSDLVCPTPAGAFVFLDESPTTINDGYLQLNLAAPSYPDIPANYLDGGCGFSFADGHGEYHKWIYSTSDPSFGLRNVPTVYGYTPGGGHWGSTGLDFDWKWLREHAACHQ